MAVVENMSILAAYLSSILAAMSGGSQLLETVAARGTQCLWPPILSMCPANSEYVHIPLWSFILHQTPNVGYVAR